MRYALALFLLTATQALGDEKPIPQDPAKVEKQDRERLEWNLRTSVGAYDKVGKKDPRWDSLVRKTLELAVRQSGERATTITAGEINKAAKAAIDAGCEDPLVASIYARSSGVSDDLGLEELIRRRQASAKKFAASRYPALRRASTIESAGIGLLSVDEPSDAAKKEAKADFDAALALLTESVKADERNAYWEDKWHDTLVSLIRDYRKLGMSAPAAYERVDAKMAKIPEFKGIRLVVRGSFWIAYGWEARTTAFAPRVPTGGFESLEERLAVAKKAFEEAWRLRPDNAYVAANLMDIDKAIGGDRDTMELWFGRAMKADGDRRSACLTKLDWLDPKWHGTREEMVAFGRQCRDTKNWRAGLTLLCADAHFRYADRLSPDERKEYLATPEVWSEITSVYDEYLKHYPNDSVARSKYASLAFIANHLPEAHAQFQAVGDNLTSWTEVPYFPLASLKRMRDETAKVVSRIEPARKNAAKP